MGNDTESRTSIGGNNIAPNAYIEPEFGTFAADTIVKKMSHRTSKEALITQQN